MRSLIRRGARRASAVRTRPYDGLFEPDWYRETYPDVAADGMDPLRHYLRHGSAEGRRPNPWFQPSWYRARYPDVAASPLEPLRHYAQHGWKEGRDPSPAFSTAFYLSSNPDVARAGLQPLHHFLRHGQGEGRAPHPLLSPLDLRAARVGIVLSCSGPPDAPRPALDALARAGTRVPFDVTVVEAASPDAPGREVEGGYGFPLHRVELPRSFGPADRINTAIRRVLASDATHVCLLDAAAVVPEHWLEHLLDTCEPVVGPVTNAIGTEQGVPTDHDPGSGAELWEAVVDCARRRRLAWGGHVAYATSVDSACLLVRREVWGRVDLLDAAFSSKRAVDADLGLRVTGAGYRPAVHRGVFVHERGARDDAGSWRDDTGSWRDDAGSWRGEPEDAARFQRRHGRPWPNPLEAMLDSWRQDVTCVPSTPGAEAFRAWTLSQHAALGVEAARRLASADQGVAVPDPRTQHRDDPADPRAEAGTAVPEARGAGAVSFGPPHKPRELRDPAEFRAYATLLRHYWAALDRRGRASFTNLSHARPLLEAVAAATAHRGSVLVLATADPVTGDPRDGYAQRVIAIDRLFSGRARFYLRYAQERFGRPTLTRLAEEIWVLEAANGDDVAEALLDALAATSGLYVHSVFALSQETSQRLVRAHARGALLDLHGAVPEEFRMCGDPFLGQTFDAVEREFCRTVGRIVCISRQMVDHIGRKHGVSRARAIVCPIFLSGAEHDLPARFDRERPRVIYVGGVQRWQRMDRVVDAVIATAGHVDHTILTPGVEEVGRMFAQRRRDPDDLGVTVRTAAPAEVLEILPRFDFGLLLREPSVVNRVSCPTKLVEYVTCGVIPILDFPDIGDFKESGMHHVTLDDFLRGAYPDARRRARMARENRDVLRAIQEASHAAQREITAWSRGGVIEPTASAA